MTIQDKAGKSVPAATEAPSNQPDTTGNDSSCWRGPVLIPAVIVAVLLLFIIIQTTTYSTRESELFASKAALRVEKRVLEGQLESLRLVSKAREKELADVAAAVTMIVTREKAKLIEEKNTLGDRLKTLRQDSQSREKELSDVAAAVTITVTNQKAKLIAEKAKLEERVQELSDVAAAVALKLTKEKANLRDRVKELEDKQTLLNTQNDNLVRERNELAQVVVDLSVLKEQLETLSSGIGDLQARSEKLSASVVKLKSGE